MTIVLVGNVTFEYIGWKFRQKPRQYWCINYIAETSSWYYLWRCQSNMNLSSDSGNSATMWKWIIPQIYCFPQPTSDKKKINYCMFKAAMMNIFMFTMGHITTCMWKDFTCLKWWLQNYTSWLCMSLQLFLTFYSLKSFTVHNFAVLVHSRQYKYGCCQQNRKDMDH